MNEFLYWRSFYREKFGSYISHVFIVRQVQFEFDTIHLQ